MHNIDIVIIVAFCIGIVTLQCQSDFTHNVEFYFVCTYILYYHTSASLCTVK